MPARRARAAVARTGVGLLVLAAGTGAFVLTRPQEDPLPTTTTTTTFPANAYLDAMSASLQAKVPVPLDEAGARCIAEALLTVLGADALHDLADHADPLGALTPQQRDQALRIVVTCLDPAVAASLLGGGAPASQGPVTLPTEDG